MSAREEGRTPRIMVVGAGDLAGRLTTLLLSDPATNDVVVAGRDPVAITRQLNLSLFTATNLGAVGRARAVRVDLTDVDATAETIAEVRPDIVVMTASLQSWRIITQLPPEVFGALDEAQFGPWLPMHLTLNHLLMRAVRDSGVPAEVVNAAFPDAVGPVLDTVGLAPTIGAGNVANIVPALRHGYAIEAGEDPRDVQVRLVAQHYFSHYVPRYGDEGNGSYHMTATAGDRSLDHVDHRAVFAHLDGRLKRLGGVAGQLLTASSVMRVVRGLATGDGVAAHAPAPNGLPGGYPVRIGPHGAELDLPDELAADKAIRINEDCQRADGIESIDDRGTVAFTEREMSIMTEMLGYRCRTMTLEECPGRAAELAARYGEFAARFA